MSVNILVEYFSEELKQVSNPASAKNMAAYMKNKFPFYGVHAPQRKAIVNKIWKTDKPLITKEIRSLSELLWMEEQRENQMIAIDLLGKCKKSLSFSDLKMLEDYVTTKSWWDTVDFLASHNVGEILSVDKAQARRVAESYMASDNLWLKRTAIIFQLKYKDKTDPELLFDMILSTHGSKEFFINKASGWALRQYSKHNPCLVRDFINDYRAELAKLTIKEGSKYL